MCYLRSPCSHNACPTPNPPNLYACFRKITHFHPRFTIAAQAIGSASKQVLFLTSAHVHAIPTGVAMPTTSLWPHCAHPSAHPVAWPAPQPSIPSEALRTGQNHGSGEGSSMKVPKPKDTFSATSPAPGRSTSPRRSSDSPGDDGGLVCAHLA